VVAHVPFSTAHQAPLWLFTGNWLPALPNGFGHFWSLALEEQFYLFWPLLVVGLPPRRLLPACLWIAAGALLLRCVLVAYGAQWFTLYANTACRMDTLALGAAAACVLRIPARREALRRRLPAVGAAALLVFLAGGSADASLHAGPAGGRDLRLHAARGALTHRQVRQTAAAAGRICLQPRHRARA
jgi:peptidoglycan/LPS O-acetylase OafA/YrhL